MVKNILIISSTFTGHGHKSITDSLLEHFIKFPDIKVHVIDGFSLGGNLGLRVGKLYGSLTRNAKDLWKLIWEIQLKSPSLANEIVEIIIKESLLKNLRNFRPDLILTVHPTFNGSVMNIFDEYNIRIPFVTLLADLVSITPLWADPRVDYVICPTIESKEKCMEFGVPESKIVVTGFPIRSKFTRHIGENERDNTYDPGKPLKCLIMSGGEGSGNMSRVAKILLKNFNCHIRIVTGRNTIMKRRLERTLLAQYPDKVEIFGFVDEIQNLMIDSDIAFTRGSPNTMLEAVYCNTPIIITGALPGQEEGNPAYAEKYNLGVVCKDITKLKGIVTDLLADGAKKLNDIKKSQREYRTPDSSRQIVEFLMDIEKVENSNIPESPKKLKRLQYADQFRLKARELGVKSTKKP